eukprot:gene27140-2371_t
MEAPIYTVAQNVGPSVSPSGNVGPRQEVISLPIAPTVRSKLLACGFRTTAELETLGPIDLSKGARSASELYSIQKNAKKVVSFCADLDRILGGGVQPGHVTEFCGVPGVGKTQLCIQLAVDVQIPPTFGDTEGSFMVERAHDIATAAVKHINNIASKKPHLDAEGAGLSK